MVVSAVPRVLVIDNYDSYTYNLVHLFGAVLGNTAPTVVRADAYKGLRSLTDALGTFDAFIISPGPGSPHCPSDFLPLPTEVLRQRRVPVLGVCLGHQALCAAYGAAVVPAKTPAHGQISSIAVVRDVSSRLFEGVPSSFKAVRYHSLVVDPSTLPSQIIPVAWTTEIAPSNRVLMAVQHSRFPLFGVQFHPESICTEHGFKLALNFIRISEASRLSRAIPWQSVRCEYRRKAKLPTHSKLLEPEPVRNTKKLRCLTHCIPRVALDTQAIFSHLYASSPESFWLDSSSHAKSSLSRCSSLDSSGSQNTKTYMDEEVRSPSSLQTNVAALGPRGRFSIMGAADGPRSEVLTYCCKEKLVTLRSRSQPSGDWEKVQIQCSIFDFLAKQLIERQVSCPIELPLELNGGYIGYFGYELKAEVAGVPENRHLSKLPDAWFIFADRLLIFDHETNNVHLTAIIGDDDTEREKAQVWFSKIAKQIDVLSNQEELQQQSNIGHHPFNFNLSANRSHSSQLHSRFESNKRSVLSRRPLPFYLERTRPQYQEDIKSCLTEIFAGESYEICLTNRLRTRIPDERNFDPFGIYCVLRTVNPAPYAAFLRLSPTIAVCCSSPERYMRISSNGVAESKPIKGTSKRGDTLERDRELREKLARSRKDRSENLMIVDLVRNDLAQKCQVGSVTVPRLMEVESFATVHQLVSTVRGTLAKEASVVDCIREAYPMGSMTGAPKVRTLGIIDRLEHSARGVYSGSIGFLSLCGAVDLNVVIRTAVLTGRDVSIGVGGAIVALSDVHEEFNEILVKGSAIMQALAISLTGQSDYHVVNVNHG